MAHFLRGNCFFWSGTYGFWRFDVNSTVLIALITSAVTAPVLSALVAWFREKGKDQVQEDHLRVTAMKEIIDELRAETKRLRDNINALEAELEELRQKLKKYHEEEEKNS